MLYQSPLVFEGITLALVVKLVVEVLVNLATVSVLDQQASEDSGSSHPQYLAICLSAVHSTE
jgi:hypothetical protein